MIPKFVISQQALLRWSFILFGWFTTENINITSEPQKYSIWFFYSHTKSSAVEQFELRKNLKQNLPDPYRSDLNPKQYFRGRPYLNTKAVGLLFNQQFCCLHTDFILYLLVQNYKCIYKIACASL